MEGVFGQISDGLEPIQFGVNGPWRRINQNLTRLKNCCNKQFTHFQLLMTTYHKFLQLFSKIFTTRKNDSKLLRYTKIIIWSSSLPIPSYIPSFWKKLKLLFFQKIPDFVLFIIFLIPWYSSKSEVKVDFSNFIQRPSLLIQ